MRALIDYIYGFLKKNGCNPPFVPVTREEIKEVKTIGSIPTSDLTKQIYGISVFVTPYAKSIRYREQITGYILPKSPTFSLETQFFQEENKSKKILEQRLEAFIVTDTTELEVELVCDPLENLKKRLTFLQKWLPIRTKKVKINGRVLYPYLNISLPNNRHHVQFHIK